MQVEVKIPAHLILDIQAVYKNIAEPTLVGLATETQHKLMSQKPPPPGKGSGEFVSDKQRKYVMAAIREGRIEVPYRRGISPGTQRMNRSFKLFKAPSSVYLTNSASYWQFVIGGKQATIHQGRWGTVDKAQAEILRSGLPEKLVAKALRKYFKEN